MDRAVDWQICMRVGHRMLSWPCSIQRTILVDRPIIQERVTAMIQCLRVVVANGQDEKGYKESLAGGPRTRFGETSPADFPLLLHTFPQTFAVLPLVSGQGRSLNARMVEHQARNGAEPSSR